MREKAGIYTITEEGGNLTNIATGEVILSDKTREEIEDILWEYKMMRERSPSEYLFVSSQITDTLELSPEELREMWDE